MAEKKEKKVKTEKERGASDELEVMKLIIEENFGLRLKVLNKLRMHREMSKESIFDAASKKSPKSSGKKK